MKISLIISSFNQRRRLKFSLESAVHQQLGPNAEEYEVIIADDNSTDGTEEMYNEFFPSSIYNTRFVKNIKSFSNTYTLAENWNCAALYASGDRLVFSNGDLIYGEGFIEAHADPNMHNHILIGPGYRTLPTIGQLIDGDAIDYSTLVRLTKENLWSDMRLGQKAHEYNVEEVTSHVYGYNFSLPKKFFNDVQGFDPLRQYGAEDAILASKVVKKFNCKILTNCNAVAIHLWHPQHNFQGNFFRKEYNL